MLCGELVENADFSRDIPLCGSCRERIAEIGGQRCKICGRELYSEQETCYDCRGRDRACSQVYPLFSYRGGVAALMRGYKSSKRISLAAFWATLMARVIDERWPGTAIVPVPPRPEKIAKREWDQIESIALVLEKNGYGIERILERKASLQQKRLNKEMRKVNAEKAYSLMSSAPKVLPTAVVLIDDVYTTGATIEACAAALREGGVADIAALVIAAD